jgi:HPt (histidine-containing phosphotransfer) domain-containing protein
MSPPVLDPARLEKLGRLGGRALVVQLIDSFLEQGPARRRALDGGRLEDVGHVAHQLVAGAGQLGATPLCEVARTVDESARRGDRVALGDQIPQLITALEEATAALRRAKESA